MAQKEITVPYGGITSTVFGSFDSNIRMIESAFSVRIYNRSTEADINDHILVEGDESNVESACLALGHLVKSAAMGNEINEQVVNYAISMVADGELDELSSISDDSVFVTSKGKPIKSKTFGQKKYVDKINRNTIVFGVGPAGTGKTYLAVAMAVKALRAHTVNRIILTRPAVEAGERLGFLPGDLQSKIDPYLRPLYDALYDMMGAESCSKLIEKMVIEIAPLAYMRGRTLDNSFIILDEAQNTTPEQMKMFLTRLGNGSKMVVTGDLTQTDLPSGVRSGLREAVDILSSVPDIAVHEFTDKDVVRHRLVQNIILAYDKFEQKKRENRAKKSYKMTPKKAENRKQ